MGGEPFDPSVWVKQLAETASRIRFAPGVIGKSTMLNIGVVAIWAVVFFRLSPELQHSWYNAALFCGAILVTAVIQRANTKNREFAEKNPALALMEGADITEYQKFQAQVKGMPALPASPVIPDPTRPPVLSAPHGPEEHG